MILLLGIFPQETMNSAVKKFLCKDVPHDVIYKDENLEASNNEEWVILMPECGRALESVTQDA